MQRAGPEIPSHRQPPPTPTALQASATTRTPLRVSRDDRASVTDIRIGEFETGLFVVLLLRHHAIEPDHAGTSVGEGRVPYVQSIAAATHIFSHDVQAKEGESSRRN